MWEKIKSWFGHSETILLARSQVLLGAVGAVVTALVNDPNTSSAVQSLLKPEYIPYYVIGIGILTEVLRRRGATDLQ
jgi:hypothetical protein